MNNYLRRLALVLILEGMGATSMLALFETTLKIFFHFGSNGKLFLSMKPVSTCDRRMNKAFIRKSLLPDFYMLRHNTRLQKCQI